MKTIHLCLFVCFVNSAWATNYYFSAVSGNDSRTVTQAQNPSTPWKTINKLNSIFSSLKGGDHVLFKRGETFYGSIIVKKSGTSNAPIVIGAYGSGNKPVITSLVTLGNWVSKGNGIWESYNSSLGSTVNIVLLNGTTQEMGRYPNSDAANKGYLFFESHYLKSSITDYQLTSAIKWTGAELVIRTRRWIIDRNLITNHSGTKIYYKTSSVYEPRNDYGYFIQNHIKTLNKFGEWYYNRSTKKLSVYFGSNGPSSSTVQATTKGNLVSSYKFSNIIFDNLSIKGANDSSLNIKSGSNITVKNCDILFSGKDGVAVNNFTNFKVENCTISNSNNNGIKLAFGVNYSTIRNNKILNTALIAGMGISGDGQGVAIYNNGDANIIEYNEIRKAGFLGVSFRGHNTLIKNNLIDSFCFTKDDGAGIYSNTAFTSYKGTKIIGNIVMNGIGAIPGTGPSVYSTSGIYLDNNNSTAEINGNSVTNCHDFGIYIHNSANMTIRNNTFYNNKIRQLNMIQDAEHPSSVRRNVMTNNIFFAKFATQLTSHIESGANDITYFGKFDSNYYARPLDDRITIFNRYPGSTSNFDLAGWKKEYGKDPASKITAKQIAPYKVNSLIGSNKVANGTFTSSIIGTGASYCKLSWSTAGLLDGGYLQVTPSAKRSYASMKIGSLTAGKRYILKYSSRGSVANMSISAYLRINVSPFTALTEKQSRKVSTTRSENEIMFIPSSSHSSASVVFQADQQSKYYLDNIKVYQVDASITNIDDSLKFVYNATTANKTVSLTGTYMDTKGSKFSNSITLRPYASAILIKTTSSTNKAPTVNVTSPSNYAKYNAPAMFKLTAAASDADGTIAKVAFYNGTKLLHTQYVYPYGWTWWNVPGGNYSITAKATDNSGNTTTSAPIQISVNKAPTVKIISPSNSAKYSAGSNIRLTASASDADGSISKVEFYRGTTLIHAEVNAPYDWTWEDVPAGNYKLTAKATDNKGLKTESSIVSISVASTQKRSTISSADTTSTDENSINIIDSGNSLNLSNTLISLKVGPNPARNNLNIYTSGLQQTKKLVISIYSISGVLIKTIQSSPPNQVVQLDVSSFSRGAYIVRAISGDLILSKQFVKL